MIALPCRAQYEELDRASRGASRAGEASSRFLSSSSSFKDAPRPFLLLLKAHDVRFGEPGDEGLFSFFVKKLGRFITSLPGCP